jgi:hypothetical protein
MTDETFSAAQLAQIALVVKEAVREEMGDAGLRLDGADHVDEARRDYMFLRALRKGVNGTAAKIGWFFIAAVLGAIVWLVNGGLNLWKGN